MDRSKGYAPWEDLASTCDSPPRLSLAGVGDDPRTGQPLPEIAQYGQHQGMSVSLLFWISMCRMKSSFDPRGLTRATRSARRSSTRWRSVSNSSARLRELSPGDVGRPRGFSPLRL
jgi:hypothetical protein